MASRRTQGAAGPSRSSARQQALPITAYGAPASHIDTNAIGFDGIRSLQASGAAHSAGPAPAGGVQPRNLSDLLALNPTLEEENRLPRSERNLLREYRNLNNIPRTAPLREPAPQQEQPLAAAPVGSRVRPSANAPIVRTPGLRQSMAAAAPPHIAETPLAGYPTTDLVPNANGAGAQRREPFASTSNLRTGTNTNVLNASMARQAVELASSAASGSRTGSGSGSRRIGGDALDLSYKQQQPKLHNFAMRAPDSAANSDAESAGQRRARAARDGTVIPDSSSSNMSLSPRPSRRTGRLPGQGSDAETDSESAGEGQKHTRHLSPSHRAGTASSTRSGVSAQGNASNATPRASRTRTLAAKLTDEDDPNLLQDAADRTIQAAGKAPVPPTPRRGGSRHTAHLPAGMSGSVGAAAFRPVHAPRPALSTCQILSIIFMCMLASLATQLLARVHDPVELLQRSGVPVPDWVSQTFPPIPVANVPSGKGKSSTQSSSSHATPPDFVRTAALDSVSKKLDRLSSTHRKDKLALEQSITELASKYGVAEEDMEQILKQLKAVSGRVEAVEKQVKAVSSAMDAAGVGAAPALKGKKMNDVVTFADLRKYHADQTGREDLSNPLAGARIAPELTTWDAWWGGRYGTKPSGGFFKSRFSSSRNFLRLSSNPQANSPHWALTPVAHAGHCWQFPGTEAQLGIYLARPAKIGAFSIEHVQRELVADRKSAPLEVELWGVVDADDREKMDVLDTWRRRMEADRAAAKLEADGSGPHSINAEWDAWVAEGGDQPQPVPPAANFVLLGTIKYNLDGPEVQTVEIKRSAKLLLLEMDTVQFRFKGNHGATNTCVYRVRVHPELGQQDA
ncbi:hypothetical protein OC835_002940 [Tilletia horrida]|nr:hypothetical protein OC835_002940 [Tilletia horrida]